VTLEKHLIRGLPRFTEPTMSAIAFENLMFDAGYIRMESEPARDGRHVVYFEHEEYGQVTTIYSPNKKRVVTAYHSKKSKNQ
jgi:hypothetical protein